MAGLSGVYALTSRTASLDVPCSLLSVHIPFGLSLSSVLKDSRRQLLNDTNALGCGQQKGYHESYRGVDIEVNLLKKVRIEIAVNADFVDQTIEGIVAGARTGTIGDGKIFIIDLFECIRIRTGEKGEKAIG